MKPGIVAAMTAACIFIALPSGAENRISIDVPPASLEQWYKPVNKRQVWLHTMFRLRREMQAIAGYAETNDQAAMEKWIGRLQKDYNKIAEMVPEWEKEVKPRLIPELEMFADRGDGYRISRTLEMIQRTCDDCHINYQALVTAMYRTPDYDDIQVIDAQGGPHDFEWSMEQLSESVNRVLIALDDRHYQAASNASIRLAEDLESLAESCSACHEDDSYPRERILGLATRQRLEKLTTAIADRRTEDSQKLMGEIGVTVCARCHNTHRIVYDLRNSLLSE